MHVQTHILSGWCVANLLPTTPRQRLAAMVAASAADVDGVSILFGREAYWSLHHTFGHNVLFALLGSAALAGWLGRGRRWATFALCLVLFHLHLLLDSFGSGPDWHIHYLWPIPGVIRTPWAWPFYSWQNLSTFFALLGWTVWIAVRHRRTPLEFVMPKLDQELTAAIGRGTDAEGKR